MKIIIEQELTWGHFWAGGLQNAKELTQDELRELEAILEDLFPDGIEETTLNDLMWFDFDTVLEWLGREDEIEV